jgi:hypothetical protein
MSVEYLLLLVRRQTACDRAGAAERVFDCGELFDQRRPALEQLGELVCAQLPR